jgi:hypothetical protein
VNDELFKEITSALERIETKIDASAARFEQHTADDALMAADIKTMKLQRGYMSGFAAALVAIGAGIAYAARRLFGN